MTNSTKRAIELSIEGGWKSQSNDSYDIGFRYGKVRYINTSSVFLDPLFWQALGKAMGWEIRENGTIWRNHWHRFIDHLAEGKDPDEFFNELLK